MKRVFLLFGTFLPIASIVGQSIALRTKLSEVVVEGIVMDDKVFGDGDGIIYTSNIIKVEKIFKGNIVGDQIEVLTLGGKVGNRRGNVSHGHIFKKGHRGIFFCRKDQKMAGHKFTITGIEGGFIAYLKGEGNPVAADIFSSYQNIFNDVYRPIISEAKKPVRILTPQNITINYQFIVHSLIKLIYG